MNEEDSVSEDERISQMLESEATANSAREEVDGNDDGDSRMKMEGFKYLSENPGGSVLFVSQSIHLIKKYYFNTGYFTSYLCPAIVHRASAGSMADDK